MKVLLLCLLIWLSVLGLACYLLGLTLVYFILLVILIGIVVDGELIPWRGKKIIEAQPRYVRSETNQLNASDAGSGLPATKLEQVINTSHNWKAE